MQQEDMQAQQAAGGGLESRDDPVVVRDLLVLPRDGGAIVELSRQQPLRERALRPVVELIVRRDVHVPKSKHALASWRGARSVGRCSGSEASRKARLLVRVAEVLVDEHLEARALNYIRVN